MAARARLLKMLRSNCSFERGSLSSTFELLLTAGFGGIGYVLRAYGFEPTPLLLGFVLSQPLEEHFRRAMLFSDNDQILQ